MSGAELGERLAVEGQDLGLTLGALVDGVRHSSIYLESSEPRGLANPA